MSQRQHNRCYAQYCRAKGALETLAERPLNLDPETRQALDEARGALERFDYLRSLQPTRP